MTNKNEVSNLALDRETSTRFALDALIKELYHYAGDLYYEVQSPSADMLPTDVQAMYEWADRMNYFYKQCLETRDMLHKRTPTDTASASRSPHAGDEG